MHLGSILLSYLSSFVEVDNKQTMNSSSLSNSINYSTIPSIVTDSPNAIANITAPIIAANATVRVFGLSCNRSIKYLRFGKRFYLLLGRVFRNGHIENYSTSSGTQQLPKVHLLISRNTNALLYLWMRPWRAARPTPLTLITSVPFSETYIPNWGPSSLLFLASWVRQLRLFTQIGGTPSQAKGLSTPSFWKSTKKLNSPKKES